MKRLFVALLILASVFSFTACTKKVDTGLKMDSGEVAKAVYDWKLYTNPAYRYEVRFPKDWAVFDSGEDGKQAAFYPVSRGEEVQQKSETYFGSIIILAKSNWENKYTLEDYYRQQTENLFLGNYETEKIVLDGKDAVWFKNVRNRNIEKPDLLVDIIALELGDRILEIEVQEKEYWSQIKTILNSIKFYPNASPAEMK